MKFDIPGRTEPTKVILYRDFREHVFPLPYEATDPIEIEMLREYPLTQEVIEAAPAVFDPPFESIEEAKPLKPSRKEV